MTFVWPKPVWVYDYENDKLVREMQDLRTAKQFVNRQKDEHVITFRKLKNISRDINYAWVYSNHEEFDIPTVRVEEWFAKVMRSKATVADLPTGVIEYFVLAAKQAYYNSDTPLMTDRQFDAIELLLKKENKRSPSLTTGIEIDEQAQGGGKVALPFYMGSMNKIKDRVEGWKFPGPYVASEKLDGVSLLYHHDGKEAKLFTRGNGIIGQDVTHLIQHLGLPKLKNRQSVRGELLMSKSNFKKFAKEFKNPRNMMAGLANRKGSAHPALASAHVVMFEQLAPRMSASKAFASLKAQGFKVPWFKVLKKLSGGELLDLLLERKAKSDYEMDGLVITDDGNHSVNKSGNPDYSFAFKSEQAEERVQTKVTGIRWNVSRHSQIKPTAVLEPIDIAGVTVTYATLHNAKYVVENSIGKGAIVEIRRSGDVIPFVERVVRKARKPDMPLIPYEWDKTNVNLLAIDKSTTSQKAQQLSYTLRALGVENIGPNTCWALVDIGYDDVVSLLSAKPAHLKDELGPAKAKILVNDVKVALAGADAVTLMAVSGAFGQGVGERKLQMVIDVYPDFPTLTTKAASQLDVPKGFSSSSFDALIQQLPAFQAFAKSIGRTRASLVGEQTEAPKSGKLSGKTFLFTGVRDKDLEGIIKANGGTVASGFSSKVSYVVAADVNSSSSKAVSARRAGIPVITLPDAYKMVKGMKIVATTTSQVSLFD